MKRLLAWLGVGYVAPLPEPDYPLTIDVLRAVQALEARLAALEARLTPRVRASASSSPRPLDCGHVASSYATDRHGQTQCLPCQARSVKA